MTKIICPKCNSRAALYKYMLNDLWRVACMKVGCNWESEPYSHHSDIAVPLKERLKEAWR